MRLIVTRNRKGKQNDNINGKIKKNVFAQISHNLHKHGVGREREEIDDRKLRCD